MVRKSWVASTCPKELFSSAVTVAGEAVVSSPAAAYCCCCQSSRNASAVGSADSSDPKPVASPMTSTPTATMTTAASFDRFARRAAAGDFWPGLADGPGAT